MPVRRLYTRRTIVTILALAIVLAAAFFVGQAIAREGRAPKPITAPAALLKARETCPNTASLVKCRSALRRAYASVEWQREQNLNLAREMLGKLTDWTCIHRREAAWDDAGDPYWGGLQMDRNFMRTYGRDMIRRHHGGLANTWTPREQIIVAQRAYAQNRGYHPWPTTARACGLI